MVCDLCLSESVRVLTTSSRWRLEHDNSCTSASNFARSDSKVLLARAEIKKGNLKLIEGNFDLRNLCVTSFKVNSTNRSTVS